jgi:lysophospholipase L1-like esterase
MISRCLQLKPTVARRALFCAALLSTVMICSLCQARDYSVIDIVGDSVSDGINPDFYLQLQKYGWAHMLYGQPGPVDPPSEFAITNLWPEITKHNSAVSGSTAAEWADTNSPPAYLATVLANHPDLVVIMIGGNDFLAYVEDGSFSYQEMQEYETNLNRIIGILRNNTPVPEIVMVDYYDLADGLSPQLPPAYANYRPMSSAVVAGNQLLRDIAASNGCFFVDIYDDFMHHCYGTELGDTNHLSPDYVRTPLALLDIHPVTPGHQKICELVYRQFEVLKDIPKFTDLEYGPQGLVLKWSSGINQQYTIQWSTNLLTTNGFHSLDSFQGTPPMNVHSLPLSATNRIFYRIRVE